MEYKVIRLEALYDLSPIRDFEFLLNKHNNEGWKLHSIVPQHDEDGVFCNVVVFEKKK